MRTVLTHQWSASGISATQLLLSLLQQMGTGQSLAAALSNSARKALVYQPPPPEHAEEDAEEDAEAKAAKEAAKEGSSGRGKTPGTAGSRARRAGSAAGSAPGSSPGSAAEFRWSTLGNPVMYGVPGFTLT